MGFFDFFKPVPSISAEEVGEIIRKKQQREYCLVDVRKPWEYEAGHLPGAKLFSAINLKDKMEKLDTCKTIVVYCQTGSRSKAAARYLISAGFKNVVNMQGGIMRYRGAIASGS